MIAITKKTEYGLIAMTHLAKQDGQKLISARELAEATGVPTAVLMNVLKELAAKGYVKSGRGAHGGYRIGCDVRRVTMADLIVALEGPIRLTECQGGHQSPGAGVCGLVDRCPIADPVHRIQRKLSDFFRNLTLAEMAEPAPAGTK